MAAHWLTACHTVCQSDADIEAIITKGERETAALNNKMQQFTDNARKFTMDGGMTVYDYKDEVRVAAMFMKGGRCLSCLECAVMYGC